MLESTRTRLQRVSGFTIVELLVVIVIIGILAAITIISFNGINERARISVIKNDLSQAAKSLEVFKISSPSEAFPADLASANLPTGSGVSYQYTVDNVSTPKTFCVTATLGTLNYFITSNSGGSQSGVCPGHTSATFPVNGGVVTTIATSTNGINDPRGVVTDSAGNLYVSNHGTSTILRITPAGVVSVFAGSGTSASVDGTGTGASFTNPGGITIDSSDNLYVAECNGHRIRKITPSAVVTTFAGTTSGYLDGTGTGARFFCPQGVAATPDGTLYVADSSNNRIRKVTPTGVVTTLAGSGVAGFADGTGTAAQFNGTVGIGVDTSGTVFVNDSARIRKITPAGVVTTFVGTGTAGFADGTGTAAQINPLRGNITIDPNGVAYLADGTNNRIRKITPAGVVTTFAGAATAGTTDGTGTAARFNYPRNIHIDASGVIYVNDSTSNRIRKIQ